MKKAPVITTGAFLCFRYRHPELDSGSPVWGRTHRDWLTAVLRRLRMALIAASRVESSEPRDLVWCRGRTVAVMVVESTEVPLLRYATIGKWILPAAIPVPSPGGEG